MKQATQVSFVNRFLLAVALCGHLVGCNRDALGTRVDPLPPYAQRRLGSTKFLTSHSETHRLGYSSDGRYLASAGFEEMGAVLSAVNIWDCATGRNVTPRRLKLVQSTGFAWAPGTNRLATSHGYQFDQSGVNVWTVGKDDPDPLPKFNPTFQAIAWSPQGEHIAVCNRGDKEVLLLSSQGTALHTLPFSGEERSLPCTQMLAFSPDGRELAFVSSQGICFHDVASGKQSKEIPIALPGRIYAILFLPKSDLIAVGTDRGVQLHPWKGTKPATKKWGEKPVVQLATSADNQLLALVGVAEFEVWHLPTHREVFPRTKSPAWGGVAFSPGHPELAVADRRIGFIHTGTWQLTRNEKEHHRQVIAGLISKGRFWSGEVGALFCEWDIDSGAALRTFRRKSGTAIAMANIEDEYLAVAGGVEAIEIRDFVTGKIAFELPGHSPTTTSLAYLAKQQRLISAGEDGMIRIWNLQSRELDYEFPITDESEKLSLPQVTVAPNGTTLVCSNRFNGELRGLAIGDGKLLWKLSPGRDQLVLLPVVFTPDSLKVATPVQDAPNQMHYLSYGVRLSDAVSGAELSRLDCSGMLVHSIAISPDGRYLAAYLTRHDFDREIQAWSLKSHELVAAFKGEGHHVQAMCFSFDGSKLITFSSETTGMVWDLKKAIQQRAGLKN